MGLFKRKSNLESLQKIANQEIDALRQTVGSDKQFEVVELADVLRQNDIVDVVTDNGYPFLIVTPKSNTQMAATAGSQITIEDITTTDNLERIFNEPTAQARANGSYVRELPASVSSTRVRMGEGTSVSDRASYGLSDVSLSEIGSSSPSPFVSFARREYNQDLVGLRGLQTYDKMRRNDGVVRGTLRSVKTPVLSARWFIKPCDKNKVADVNAAEWVWDNLTNGMSIGWTQVIMEALLMCDFGYYIFEIVWEDTGDRLKVRKLAPRHPMDVAAWSYDEHGGVDGAYFYSDNPFEENKWIPIDKLLVFTFDRESGSMEGISLLRSAYKHWYFKEQLYKIDAIQKERHGIGVPVVKLPVGFDVSDKQLAEELGRNLRTNERAHITLPPMWEIYFAKLEGHVVNALESIEMHDNGIRENILLQFMDAKSSSSSEEESMMFFKATRFIADTICEAFNSYLIPRMIDANFSRVGYPKVKARRIGESADWRTLSFAVRNLIGCGALRPDDKLEDWLRDEMDMPEVDEETVRNVVSLNVDQPDEDTGEPTEEDGTTNSKQNGQKVGLPRGGKPIKNQPGRKTGGNDASGG